MSIGVPSKSSTGSDHTSEIAIPVGRAKTARWVSGHGADRTLRSTTQKSPDRPARVSKG